MYLVQTCTSGVAQMHAARVSCAGSAPASRHRDTSAYEMVRQALANIISFFSVAEMQKLFEAQELRLPNGDAISLQSVFQASREHHT